MTAEELLMSDEVEIFQYSNVIEIDGQSRHVNVPIGEDMFGVEGDENVTLKHFTCPKIVGNNIEIDLSDHNLYVNYTLADEKGNPKSEDVIQSPCENIVIGDDNITFDWKISEWVTKEDGYIAFSIVAKKSVDGVVETRWYTTPAVGKVLKTVKEGRHIEQQYPDVIDNLMNRVSDLERILANGGGTGGSIVVDDALSETSTNPVQNKVVAKEIRQLSEEKADKNILNTGFKATTLDGILKEIYQILNGGGTTGDNFDITTGSNIPEIYFVGDSYASMTKENAVDLGITINVNSFTWTGYSNTKWQGNSSLSYDKKNFTIKLFDDSDKTEKRKFNWNGWGKQNKFVLKANYIDHSHCRNIVGAKLWGEMVASREDYNTLPEELRNSPNNGAIDGFPIKVTVNGVYQGLYTLNIPKDGWTFNMDEDNANHAVLCAEQNNNGVVQGANERVLACEFRGNANIDGYDWSLEFPDTLTNSIHTSFNNLIDCVKDTTNSQFKSKIGNYLNIPSAIDYYIFHYLLCGLDSLGKNMIMMTYDGTKWLCSSYDMDSLMGLFWDGSKFVSSNYQCPEQYQETNSLLWQRIESVFANDVKARWNEVKETVLSVDNIVSKVTSFMGIISDELYEQDLEVYPSIPQGNVNHLEQITNFITERTAYVDAEISNLVQAEIGEDINVTALSLDNNALSLDIPNHVEMIDYNKNGIELNKNIYNGTTGDMQGSILTNPIELDIDNYYNFVTTQTDCGDKNPKLGKYDADGTLIWTQKLIENPSDVNDTGIITFPKVRVCEMDTDGNKLADTVKLFRIKKEDLVLSQRVDTTMFDGLEANGEGDLFVKIGTIGFGDIIVAQCEQSMWSSILLYNANGVQTVYANNNNTNLKSFRNAGGFVEFGFKVKKAMVNNGYSMKYEIIKASSFNDIGTLNATLTPSNATKQEVTWATSDDSVAIIEESGLSARIKGLKPGTSTITCTSQDTTNGTISAECTVTVI